MLIYHPVGTCRTSDGAQGAVVDSESRVHGLAGLRVVDPSVMPIIPGGNTNAPTILIADRAADLIRGRVQAAGGRVGPRPRARSYSCQPNERDVQLGRSRS